LGLGLIAAMSLLFGDPGQPAQAEDLSGDTVVVHPARAAWDTGWFQTEIYIRALQAIGYRVERPVTLANPDFYAAVARGEVDFWVNGWIPLHKSFFDGTSAGAEVVGYVARGGALQGYLVDKSTAEAHDLTNLADFKKPEIRALFDSDGDGLAELVACPSGWGCELVIDHQLKTYGLRNYIEPIKADYTQSMRDSLERHREGHPVLFYTWTPNWTVGVLRPGEDVSWIEVPFQSLPGGGRGRDVTKVANLDGCRFDPCDLGWPINDIRPVANSAFLVENPAAWRLFKIMSIPLADISAQNARMFAGEDGEDDLMRHADAWIDANRQLFDQWIADAVKAPRCVALMKRVFGAQNIERWSEICIAS
jgi:glycine betaine/proline transport system substrate-binding protein